MSIYEFSEDSPSNGLGLYELTLPVNGDRDINVFSIHQNVVVFVEGRNLYVWNMAEDTGTAWVVEEARFEEAGTLFLNVEEMYNSLYLLDVRQLGIRSVNWTT